MCFLHFLVCPLPINIKCVHHLAKSHILSYHPKSIPFAHQELFGVSIISLVFTEFTYILCDVSEISHFTKFKLILHCFQNCVYSTFCVCAIMSVMYGGKQCNQRIIFQQKFMYEITMKHTCITMQFMHNYVVSHMNNHNCVKVQFEKFY